MLTKEKFTAICARLSLTAEQRAALETELGVTPAMNAAAGKRVALSPIEAAEADPRNIPLLAQIKAMARSLGAAYTNASWEGLPRI
jgi:hypothetical protein